MDIFLVTDINENQQYNIELFQNFEKHGPSQGIKIVGVSDHADIVLFSTMGLKDAEILGIPRHPLVRKFPGKCFLLCDRDLPFPVLPGLYAGLSCFSFIHHSIWKKYFRTIFYFSDHNPFITEWALGQDIPPIYLFSFVGSVTSPVRAAIFRTAFKRTDIHIQKTDSSLFWDDFFWIYGIRKTRNNEAYLKQYAQNIFQSKFVLCPKGNGIGSYRFFEVMEAGRVPVLLSDNYVLPNIPYDWNDLIIRIKESDVSNLEQIILDNEHRFQQMSAFNKKVFNECFLNKGLYIYSTLQDLYLTKPIRNGFDYFVFQIGWLSLFKTIYQLKTSYRKLFGLFGK